MAISAALFSKTIAGVRLDRYAGICASLIESFSLQAALENDGMAPKTWERGAPAWAARLGAESPAGPLRAAYAGKVLEARAFLGRRILPLDADLESWLSFLAAFSVDPEPVALLRRLGLRRADMTHLQALWAGRIDGSPELTEQAREIASKRKAAVPQLRITPATLRPFPWSDLGRPSASSPEPLEEAVRSWPADRLRPAVEIATPSFLLQRPGASDRHSAASPRTPSPRTPLDPGTSEIVLPAAITLPFTAAPKSAPGPETPPAPAAAPAGSTRKGLPSGDTAAVFELPKGLVLPFSERDSPGPEAPAPSSAGRSLQETSGETSPILELPRCLPLPFVLGPALGTERRPLGESKKAPSMPTGTADVLELPAGPPLPFASSPAAGPATSGHRTSLPEERGEKRPSLGETVVMFDLRTLLSAPPSRAPALAPGPAVAPTSAVPLTMEQHASLCAELALHPGREAEILARYRVTAEARARLDEHYAALAATSPEKRKAWYEAYRTYHEWLVAAARSPSR